MEKEQKKESEEQPEQKEEPERPKMKKLIDLLGKIYEIALIIFLVSSFMFILMYYFVIEYIFGLVHEFQQEMMIQLLISVFSIIGGTLGVLYVLFNFIKKRVVLIHLFLAGVSIFFLMFGITLLTIGVLYYNSIFSCGCG